MPAMRTFADQPIRTKLVSLMLLTSLAALLLACLSFIAYERHAFRQTMIRDYGTLADILDDTLASGLAFNDNEALTHQLQTLRAHEHIVASAVYDKAGKRVVSYERSRTSGGFPWPAIAKDGSAFQPHRLDTFKAIPLAGEVVGTLYLGADLDELTHRQNLYLLIAGAVLLLAGAVSFLLATGLQRFVSTPIADLARTAGLVAAEKNYALRATRHGQDELGGLVDGFNAMLGQIQQQEQSLRDANDKLEQRVAERTRELREEIAVRQRAEAQLGHQTRQLMHANEELIRFTRLASGRELRVIQLKQQVNALATRLGQSQPYPLRFLDAAAEELLQSAPTPATTAPAFTPAPASTPNAPTL